MIRKFQKKIVAIVVVCLILISTIFIIKGCECYSVRGNSFPELFPSSLDIGILILILELWIFKRKIYKNKKILSLIFLYSLLILFAGMYWNQTTKAIRLKTPCENGIIYDFRELNMIILIILSIVLCCWSIIHLAQISTKKKVQRKIIIGIFIINIVICFSLFLFGGFLMILGCETNGLMGNGFSLSYFYGIVGFVIFMIGFGLFTKVIKNMSINYKIFCLILLLIYSIFIAIFGIYWNVYTQKKIIELYKNIYFEGELYDSNGQNLVLLIISSMVLFSYSLYMLFYKKYKTLKEKNDFLK